MKRDACVCGCTEPLWNGEQTAPEEPGVCACGHYLYLHWRDQLEEAS